MSGLNDFDCLDCHLTGPLTVHGTCPRCGSQAVAHAGRYGDKANQRKEAAKGIRREIAILDYRAKEKLRHSRERKTAEETGGSPETSGTLVGRGQ